MPESSDEDSFHTPPNSAAAASAPPLPPAPLKVARIPEYALHPSSIYWHGWKTYNAPIPGTNNHYAKPNPHYVDYKKAQDDHNEHREQWDRYLTYKEGIQIASAEAVVTKLRSKQAIRKLEVAKTHRYRANQLKERELDRSKRAALEQLLALASKESVPPNAAIDDTKPLSVPTDASIDDTKPSSVPTDTAIEAIDSIPYRDSDDNLFETASV